MLVIGLTGGIGSGKSSARQYFHELGIATLNADDVARELVQVGTSCYQKIIEYFGSDACMPDGQLNRDYIKRRIFNSQSDKRWLEQLLHPKIRQAMTDFTASAKSAYVVLEIPLLLESTPNPLIDRILVIDVNEQTQLDRVMQRDNSQLETIKKIIAQQIPRQQRLMLADDVINNDDDLKSLKDAVRNLDKTYRNS